MVGDSVHKVRSTGSRSLLGGVVVPMSENEKAQALQRAQTWWEGKPPNMSSLAHYGMEEAAPGAKAYVCDGCSGIIASREGTSLVGSYMRCANCTQRMFAR